MNIKENVRAVGWDIQSKKKKAEKKMKLNANDSFEK